MKINTKRFLDATKKLNQLDIDLKDLDIVIDKQYYIEKFKNIIGEYYNAGDTIYFSYNGMEGKIEILDTMELDFYYRFIWKKDYAPEYVFCKKRKIPLQDLKGFLLSKHKRGF